MGTGSKKFIIAVIALAALTAACTDDQRRVATGAGLGTAAGATVGAIATGTGGGAVVGGAIGAASGAMIASATNPNRNRPQSCQARDRNGRPIFDRNGNPVWVQC